MKIALLNDSFPPNIDGVANAVQSYARILCDRGDEPVVITPKYPHVNDRYEYKVYRYRSIPTDKLIGYRAGNPFSPSTISDLYYEKFDILHVHCPFASAVLANSIKAVSKKKIPMVFTYHTKFDIDIEKRVHIHGFRHIVTKFVISNIKKMDEVWVVSDGAGQNLRSLGYKGDYVVMPNGTDFEKGKAPESEIAAINSQYGIGADELVFLFVGRMFWYKNVGLSLEALKKLRDDGVKFHMFLIGDGEDRFAIERYAEELGISDSVTFTGAIHDREKLRAFYSRADMFLFPSTYDTSGLVVKEAAACDCPSVLVRGSCASEGVEDGVSGFMCDENADSLYSTIKSAVNDREKLRQVGVNAGNDVYYSWEDAVSAARKRYEEIIAAYKKKRRGIFRR
jgi:1,2-diacylglycerol 3-alpha-glucosyltransferase